MDIKAFKSSSAQGLGDACGLTVGVPAHSKDVRWYDIKETGDVVCLWEKDKDWRIEKRPRSSLETVWYERSRRRVTTGQEKRGSFSEREQKRREQGRDRDFIFDKKMCFTFIPPKIYRLG